MDSLTFQYIILAMVVFAACYSLYRVIKKNFTSDKDGKSGCSKGCGCS